MTTAFDPFDMHELDADASTICVLDADLRIVFVNRAWRQFAVDNGGTWGTAPYTLGVDVLSAVPQVLQSFYRALFMRASASGVPVEHSYTCSSPTTFRSFRMRILSGANGQLIVAHSLSLEAPQSETPSPAIESLYRNADGVVLQCGHCRRVRRADHVHWDWVPSYVAHAAANTSHGLCLLCERYYFQ